MYELNLKSWVVLIVTALFLITGGVGSCMYVAPKYNVWKQEMDGKAEFAKAEQNRKIKIEEAKANLEAEKLNAQAEIERAKGAAEAIKIENGSITPAYIQYLLVRQQNANTNNKIIYIPTEAGLPVLEAGRVAQSEKE
jgi:regulator of protease activity HflC (stomatin/prohibitin superfamily)